jgi:hypothetical protein
MITKNTRQPDNTGVPDMPIPKWNPDGTPDFSDLEKVPAQINDGRSGNLGYGKWNPDGTPDFSDLTNNNNNQSGRVKILGLYIQHFGITRGTEMFDALTGQQILEMSQGVQEAIV